LRKLRLGSARLRPVWGTQNDHVSKIREREGGIEEKEGGGGGGKRKKQKQEEGKGRNKRT
jgi:hypothetical protein